MSPAQEAPVHGTPSGTPSTPRPSAAPRSGASPLHRLDRALDRFPDTATLDRRGGIVAFSGGPDSTALLLALVRRRRRLGGPPLLAVHVDHAMDPGSAGRARRAARLARGLGVPLVEHRLPRTPATVGGGGSEATARRLRYAFLARVATTAGAGWIATAHHRDDQAETVLLRLAGGSGLGGLAGVRPQRRVAGTGAVLLRPLLDLSRRDLTAALTVPGSGLAGPPTRDPTNRDLSLLRNRLRHHVLPSLEAEARAAGEPPVAPRLARLARKAGTATAALDTRLAAELDLRPARHGGDGGATGPARHGAAASVDAGRLRRLPAPLLPTALALLHRAAGRHYPPGREARRELVRQLAAGDAVGCDCGDGLRWEEREGRLLLLRPPAVRSPQRSFSYILEVPGEVTIRELGLVLRLHRAPLAPWMYRGAPQRAGLDLPLSFGDRVTVRNRRPGDRMHPLGAPGRRRLKDVLMDRRVPRRERDRLPLLCLGGEVAWIPGVTVANAYRLPPDPTAATTVWVASLRTAENPEP